MKGEETRKRKDRGQGVERKQREKKKRGEGEKNRKGSEVEGRAGKGGSRRGEGVRSEDGRWTLGYNAKM